MNTSPTRFLLAIAILCLLSGLGSASAELLGDQPGEPNTLFNATGTTTYEAGNGLFSVQATPLSTLFAEGEARVDFDSTQPRSLTIDFILDANGNVVGGVPGDDLELVGTVNGFSGVLLTGEIDAFGFLNFGTTDYFDARFTVTGGQWAEAGLFEGSTIFVSWVAGGSTFAGSFTSSFSGGAKGNVGPGLPEILACRFTGGGVDTDFNWDHTLESGEMIRNGVGNLPAGIDRYQFGGQAGARTAAPPQPSGEWTHHQQTGPSGSFTFHGGTASAPAGTEIVEIRCSDPGFCSPARPAPNKQLDFDGVGTFKALGKGKSAPTFEIPDPTVTAEGNGNKTFDGTFHWFEVNVDDLGEPGSDNTGQHDPNLCPGRGFGEKSSGLHVPDPVNDPGTTIFLPATELANCDCPDFYRITIYNGVYAADVVFLPDGSIDPNSLDRTTVIYEVYGYIDGGNLQIHPPTGFDSN